MLPLCFHGSLLKTIRFGVSEVVCSIVTLTFLHTDVVHSVIITRAVAFINICDGNEIILLRLKFAFICLQDFQGDDLNIILFLNLPKQKFYLNRNSQL